MTNSRAALADELEQVRQLVREHIGPTMDRVVGRAVAALRAPPSVEGGARLWRHKKKKNVERFTRK